MRIPKRYGQSRVNNCPFCGKISVTKNKQGVPVCIDHKEEMLKDLKCVCGEWLDVQEGKWGPYFRCMNCGNINFNKGMEMNGGVKSLSSEKESSGSEKSSSEKESSCSEKSSSSSEKKNPREITVTSDQLDYIY